MMAEESFKTISEALAPTSFTAPATRALVEQYGTPSPLAYDKQLASRILELEHDIRMLKTCRNSNRPVNRLPAEVLSHIFLILYWTVQAEAAENQKVFWIYATHVCRQWRAVALGCAALWSDFACNMHGELMRTILPRSKNLSISVSLKCDGATDMEALGEVLSHTTRIRHLDLSSTGFDLPSYSVALERMGPRAPLLTTLSVSYVAPMDDECLPEDFLKDGAPSLKHLTLKNFDLHWARIPFSPALTTLHLVQSVPVHREFAEMLETFRGLQLLEELTLNDIFPQDGFQPGMKPVTLSKLKHLSLTGWGHVIGNFLLGIRVPKTTFIDLTFTNPAEWTSEVDACVASIRKLWRDDPSEWAKDSIEFFDFTALAKSPLKLAFRFDDVPESLDWEHHDDPHLTVNFLPSSTGNPDIVFLAFFREHFNLDSLSMLRFAGNSQRLARRPVLEAFFAHLPMLQSIIFVECDMTDFLHILDDDPACHVEPESEEDSAVDSTDVTACFPALHFLEIYDQHFKGNRINTIIRVLGKRPKGHRIGDLIIEDCINIDEMAAERIKEALPNLYSFAWSKKVTMDDPASDLETFRDLQDEPEF
ncbi:hypothetical protein DFP72DRAFT_115969 [Ephemerocybe angulata]|uniref:F-box domain-containing protein n=1 Tax=Ephemerocybe angulata TaxID=980116 RepID=A0A8H6I8C6_9AGAR|nr:hypothetical protein DFP72DRAFT_115969 [Tulosesus angulatus]